MNDFSGSIRLLICIPFLSLFLSTVFSQDLSYFDDLLSTKDLETIKKAYVDKSSADDIISEIAILNQELLKLEGDYELTQKQYEKKTQKVENEIKTKRNKAFKIYKTANNTIYNTLLKAINEDENDVDNETKSLAIDYAKKEFQKAEDLRKSADRMSDSQQILGALNTANESEQKAIDELARTLGIINNANPDTYLGMNYENSDISDDDIEIKIDDNTVSYPSESTIKQTQSAVSYPETNSSAETSDEKPLESTYTYTPDIEDAESDSEPTIHSATTYQDEFAKPVESDDNFTINEKIITKYQNYLEDPTIPEPFTFHQLHSTELQVNHDSVASTFWTSYHQNAGTPVLAFTDQVENAVSKTYQETAQADDFDKTENAEQSNDLSQEFTAEVITEEPIEEITEVSSQYTTTSITPTKKILSNFFYRIQIAANTKPLDDRALRTIYYGNKKVGMINEQGWYKYSIGDFETYAEADDFRKKSGLTSSFIVKYTQDVEFGSVPALPTQTAQTKVKKPITPQNKVISSSTSTADGDKIEFRVQIAASKVLLNINQLAKVYSGNASIKVIQEDNWYKYQTIGFSNFREVKKLAEKTKVKGVFIVAYKNNVKQDLKQAMNETKGVESTYSSEISYAVQLAASRYQLGQEDLNRINTNNYPVRLIVEEGWYKYQVEAGASYNKAMELKDNCNVQNAFIVAYNRSEKTKLYKAIQATRNNNI